MSEGVAKQTGIPRRSSVIMALGLVTVLIAGIVLSFSWFIDFPPTVLGAAWLVALVAAATDTVVGWHSARRSAVGFFASVKAALRELGHFIFFLF